MTDLPLLRNSERSDFKRCCMRWNWRWNENLTPIELSTGPLVFGTLAHLALAEWYGASEDKLHGPPGFKRGKPPWETWNQLTQSYWDSVRYEGATYVDDEIEGTWEDARKLGEEILLNYFDRYGIDEQWEVLWVEHPFSETIPNPVNGLPVVQYVGTIDLIVKDHSQDGRIRYVDHKFVKSIETEHLSLDDQNGGYLAIGTHQLRQQGLIGPKESVRDLVYNFVRKALPPDKPRNEHGEYLNKDGSPMKRQPLPMFERYVVTKTAVERNSQIRHIGDEALWMKAVRTGKLPLIKSPRRDCKWDCSFFNLCQVHEVGGDVEGTKRMLFRKSDPYDEYVSGVSPKRLQEK